MAEQRRPIVVFAPDLLMREQLVGGLEAAGFAVRGAATRGRLEAAVAADEPSAIVIELDGVGVDGSQVVSELKGDPATASVPVLGFCAHTKTELIAAARDAGADRVVSRGELTRRLADIASEVLREVTPG